jgi:hypothetical protein
MQLRPTPAVPKLARPVYGVDRCASGDGNQRGEMTVAVTEFKGLDPTRASVDSIADCTATGAGESGLAILLPGFV